jgi:hypothetical protein
MGNPVQQTWRPVVACHILWDEQFKRGDEIAGVAYAKLCRDVERPDSRGFGIPVFFHKWHAPQPGALIQAIEKTRADRTVIVPLVDDYMTGSDEWGRELESVLAATEFNSREYVLLPVALSIDSYNISPKIERVNFVRLYPENPEDYPQRLVAKLTHELCRMMLNTTSPVTVQAGEGPAPVRLFLSHAKQDGLAIVTDLRIYVATKSPVEAWVDDFAIGPGFDFQMEIDKGVQRSALLIVHSDLYASREWCRREVLLAKKHQCPILVVLAIDKEEDRSFPYLGNVPTIRWDSTNPRRCQEVIERAVREVLRTAHFRRHICKLQTVGILPSEYQVLTRPPEILTYVDLPRVGATADAEWNPVIYPDPPLGDEEIELIHSMWPGARLTTPISSAHWVKTKSASGPLVGTVVAISVSESPDLQSLGLSKQHLRDALQEFARHVLANGGIVAYGSKLKKGGFAEDLMDLAQTDRLAGSEPRKRVIDYVSWPIHLQNDADTWAKQTAHYRPEVIFKKTGKPDDIQMDASTYFAPSTVEQRYAWARGLTLMREEMDSAPELRARVVMGGRVDGFIGKYPGVLEEAVITLQHGEALYLCGGFGGCTQQIIRALKGEAALALTKAFQEQDSQYAELIAYYGKKGLEPIDYPRVCEYLAKKGVAGLNNGLSDADNEILFNTPFTTQMIYLVLKGLANLPPLPSGSPSTPAAVTP